MNRMMKKIALLMSIVMLIIYVPVNAYADEEQLLDSLQEVEESIDVETDIEEDTLTAAVETADTQDEEPAITPEEETAVPETATEEVEGSASPSDADGPDTAQTPETLPGSTSLEGTPSSATPSDDEDTVLEAAASDGVRVTLTGEKGAFETDDGLELKVDVVTGEDADEAGKEIDKEEKPENVAKRVTYDIRVEKDGIELQPLDGKKVSVCFSLPEVPSGADEVTVYHHDEKDGLEIIAEEDIKEATLTEIGDEEAVSASETVLSAENEAADETAAETSEDITEEELDDFEDSELINDLAIVGETDSFSLYTVDFTYEDKTVSIEGNTKKNLLADIIAKVEITDTITDVEVYGDAEFSDKCEDGTVKDGDKVLFKVYKEEGTWYVDAVNAFSTTHGIIVKTDKADYRVKVTDDGATDRFLTFTAVGTASSVTFNYYSGSNVQYSTDNGSTWVDYLLNPTIGLAPGESVKFKGENVTTNIINHFTMTGTIEASGDVTSLTNGVGGDATLTTDCYNDMFYGCTSLTTAPELPATTLAQYCYNYMFSNCSSLTSAPELPATTLAQGCYDGMFSCCHSLESAPELPATIMADKCYSGMFYGCTRLTTAPELPATTLAKECYHSMFMSCKNLTSAPELPATTLAEKCYRYMFFSCSSLTSAPEELPATTLAIYCYDGMFCYCHSLERAPELPATTLAGSCYYRMFEGCTSLTELPDLSHVTTLAGECCGEMFERCSNIKLITTVTSKSWKATSAADVSGWSSGMLKGTGGSFTGDPVAGTTYYYEVPMYTVSFNMGGHGSAVAAQSVAYGLLATEPAPAPTDQNYTFDGWYKESTYATAWNFSTDKVLGDTTIYAKWTAKGGPGDSGSSVTSGVSGAVSGSGGHWNYDKTTDIWTYTLSSGTLAKNTWMYLIWDDQTRWYHFEPDGRMDEGWFKDSDESWYYLLEKGNEFRGAVVTGWIKDLQDGYTYYLNTDGRMVTGWKSIDGNMYYFTIPSDVKEKSWVYDSANKKWVYATFSEHPLGSMWVNTTTPDGSKVDSQGRKV